MKRPETKELDDRILAILYQVLAEPIGLVVRVSDPFRARRKLHAVKYASEDVRLDQIQIRMAPESWGSDLIVLTKAAKRREALDLDELLGKK